MKARSFSHVGITVRNFNEFVRFYWEVFGCPLVGVADTPPERVRAFFGVDAPHPGELPDFVTPTPKGFVRILPGVLESDGGLDGFFIARLVRRG